MAALLLSLKQIALTFGGDQLLTGANLDVEPGARIALVGRNGSGKSTLLKIAAGQIEPDAGERFLHPGNTVAYLPQEPSFGEYENASNYIRQFLNDESEEHLIPITAEALGVDPNLSLINCSGGEARRVALAGAIVASPDILLLDEPTNHLDLPAIRWLEETLANKNAAIVVISHDRRFLKTVTNKTVWIDRGVTQTLDRGFAHFESWRDKLLEEEEMARHKAGRKLVAEEHWLRYGVTARRKRNVRRLSELKTLRQSLREEKRPQGRVKFADIETNASGKRVIVADSVSKSFDDRAIVKEFSTEIVRGEKIGIVGPNGAGKTTLVNLLTGALPPDSGDIKIGVNIDLVSLDQKRASLDPNMRLADAISDDRGDFVTVGGSKRHVATYLQDFLFAPEQWRAPVSSLSGGERGRLALAAALAKPTNLLALDEPTNDLDLETLDLLEELLNAYEGTLLLISHDRSFLDRIVTSIITTDPDRAGGWVRYPGGYDDMVAQRGAAPGDKPRATVQSAPKKTSAKKPQPVKSGAAKLSYKDKFALEQLPGKISGLEASIAKLKNALEDPDLYERDPETFNKTARRLEAEEQELAAAEEEWLALEIKREAIANE
ncbi:MAG: ATP-binding cassette domain-containing protein [Marinicaulis sp.]|nr:ATP-binding cassette domain-containing protein [Marinicaulis sp.]